MTNMLLTFITFVPLVGALDGPCCCRGANGSSLISSAKERLIKRSVVRHAHRRRRGERYWRDHRLVRERGARDSNRQGAELPAGGVGDRVGPAWRVLAFAEVSWFRWLLSQLSGR